MTDKIAMSTVQISSVVLSSPIPGFMSSFTLHLIPLSSWFIILNLKNLKSPMLVFPDEVS